MYAADSRLWAYSSIPASACSSSSSGGGGGGGGTALATELDHW